MNWCVFTGYAIIVGCFLPSSSGAKTAGDHVVEFVRVDIGHHATREGFLLMAQTYRGKPVYSVSYHINGHTVATRVVTSGLFTSYRIQLKKVIPTAKPRLLAQVSECTQEISLVKGQSLTAPDVVPICLDHADLQERAQFTDVYQKMKLVAAGKTI